MLMSSYSHNDLTNIGKKKIHEISATDRLVKDNKVFLQLVKDGVKKGQVPSQMLEETKCSVIFANELFSSYRIEQRINHGVEQHTITVGTIIRDGDTQKTLTLSDIATASQFPHMTTLIWQALMTQLKAMTIEDMRRQLSRNPLPTNNFYYNDKGLHFVYNENEIAPATLGSLDVCIPWPLPTKLHE